MHSQVLQISCFFFVLIGLEGSPPCSLYGCPQPSISSYHHHHRQEHHFLPAPPGKTPPCAKNGMTYCVDVEHYPQQLITSLVASWQFDYNTLLTSELEQNPPRPVYGPPNYKTSFPYAGNSYFEQSPPSRYNNVNFTSSYPNKGYPDRRYPLGNPNLQGLSSDPGFIYSAIIRPELVPPQVTNYDPGNWWKRYTRSNRKKRQAQQATTLCPTRTEFIMPKAAVNNQGNWKYVVNLDQDKRFTQLVGSETCLQSQCDGICSLPNGYTSRCQQQFVQKRLIALDGTGSNLYTDIFWLPHCCVCQITPSGN